MRALGFLASAFMITTPPGPAHSLDLSQLDARLQRIADAEVKEALTQFKAKSVAVVLAQPQTGRVVAFSEAHSERTAETWATRVFAPGSTTKPLVAAAALESGAISEDQSLDCQQPYAVGERTFINNDPKVKKVSAIEAIAQSVNVCTIRMAQATGKERVRRTLQQFGLDWTPSEGKELSADDAEAVLGMTLPANLATMIRAYSVLANHGRGLARPFDPVISEKTADAIVRMLVAAVDHGTGRRATLSGVAVAGKTGTVVSRLEPKDGNRPLMAIFGGFAPAEAPRLVAFVIVEGGMRRTEQAGGGAAAAPTFREVMGKSLAALDQAAR